jgi:alpha-tubulin suppressor-like RCC1 family protein
VAANNSAAHSCAVKTGGTLYCWGADGVGKLGNGADGDQTSPDQESTSATDWAQVGAGQNHSCAVKTDGTLWCWGADWNGQLGNGADGDQTSPDQESTSATDWAQVSAGQSHTCAVKTDGTLWCWGTDLFGVLGNGADGSQIDPDQESTSATDWAQVSASGSHTCAVKTDGTLWCWGGDGSGQLGNGADGDQTSPDQESTSATDWAQVSAGSSHTCAVKTGGTLWCWGADWDGQLGNGADGSQTDPDQESTAATDWAQVSAGGSHTCAAKTAGTLWCWGRDSDGQLGNGATTGTQVSPSQESTTATDWAQVSTGDATTCAVKTGGTLWCWGRDFSGQLGAGLPQGDSPIENIECLNPQRYEGTLLYNSSNNVMQYCDGVSWVQIGK